MSHQCPWPECSRVIADMFFLCSPHWRPLDRGLQAEVSAAFLRVRRATERGDAPRILEAQKHLAAVQERVLRAATAAALP